MATSQLTTIVPRLLIRLYQKLSLGFPRRCRFTPTCSEFAYQALEQLGLWRGTGVIFWRLLKCHPWHPGGYDPVS